MSMTMQEIFDTVATHLLKQGRQSLIVRATVLDPDLPPICAYRSKDGAMCAAGVLIKEEFYSPELETRWALDPIVSEALTRSGVFDKNPNLNYGQKPKPYSKEKLISALQEIHDQVVTKDWKAYLQSLAKEFELDTQVLLTDQKGRFEHKTKRKGPGRNRALSKIT